MRHFPNEILHEIFQRCLLRIPSFDKTPWALSQVCSRWRAITLYSPQLWCRFALWDDTADESAFLTKALPLQLERAARAPLTIAFGPDNPGLGSLAPLLRVSSQWETVIIGVEFFTARVFSSAYFFGSQETRAECGPPSPSISCSSPGLPPRSHPSGSALHVRINLPPHQVVAPMDPIAAMPSKLSTVTRCLLDAWGAVVWDGHLRPTDPGRLPQRLADNKYPYHLACPARLHRRRPR
ncbi:hypothetical protein C8R46DRAFT_1094693 [Mycena filopes]|nr:hypothetical protein C8R46DRAFT_1094693 [Mycena filopes]